MGLISALSLWSLNHPSQRGKLCPWLDYIMMNWYYIWLRILPNIKQMSKQIKFASESKNQKLRVPHPMILSLQKSWVSGFCIARQCKNHWFFTIRHVCTWMSCFYEEFEYVNILIPVKYMGKSGICMERVKWAHTLVGYHQYTTSLCWLYT